MKVNGSSKAAIQVDSFRYTIVGFIRTRLRACQKKILQLRCKVEYKTLF